jgi:lipopolysaccharide biosynthesis protein
MIMASATVLTAAAPLQWLQSPRMISKTMDPEALFRSQLPSIERIVAIVCQRDGMSAKDTGEFVALVKQKLVEDDYDIICKFKGWSSISTYLMVVISRLLADYRKAQ